MTQPPEESQPQPSLLRRLWRHPRRTGFIVANLVLVVAIVVWGQVTERRGEEGPLALPEIAIGITGTVLLLGVLVGIWVAWGVFLIWRHRPR